MNSFKIWLENIEEDEFISPGDLMNNNYISFIFTSDYKLYIEKNLSHSNLILKNKELFDRYKKIFDLSVWTNLDAAIMDAATRALPIDLEGRVSDYKKKQIVSFWNENKELYDKLLKSCMNELLSKNLIHKDTFISTPVHGTVSIKNLNSTKEVDLERLGLLRDLHLMNQTQKKQAMLKLGIKSHKNKWQQEMEKQNLINPGQKFWTIASESFFDII